MSLARKTMPALAALLLLGGVESAAAQSCGAQIDQLAARYDLDADGAKSGTSNIPATPAAPPATTESRGITETQRLGQSSGATATPDTGARVAIQPAPGNAGAPPSAQTQAQRPASDAVNLTAGERKQMESLLSAARAAERQGKDAQCLEQLREAEAIPGVPGSRAR